MIIILSVLMELDHTPLILVVPTSGSQLYHFAWHKKHTQLMAVINMPYNLKVYIRIRMYVSIILCFCIGNQRGFSR